MQKMSMRRNALTQTHVPGNIARLLPTFTADAALLCGEVRPCGCYDAATRVAMLYKQAVLHRSTAVLRGLWNSQYSTAERAILNFFERLSHLFSYFARTTLSHIIPLLLDPSFATINPYTNHTSLASLSLTSSNAIAASSCL